MSEVPAGSEHQHLSTGKSQQQYIHHVQKNSLERKVFFVAPPPRPAHPNPPPITCFRIIPLVLLCLHFPDWGGAGCIVVGGSARMQRDTHKT